MKAIIAVTFSALIIIFWIWAVSDILRTRFKDSVMKPLWVLIVLVFPFFGALVYFWVKRHLVMYETREFDPDEEF